MKRREFFKLGGGASLAFLINGLPVSAFANTPLLQLLSKQAANSGRVLVLIQLNGGNDGLNTVLALDRYSELSAARSNILIPSSKALALFGSITTGLHPAMKGIANMYNNGLVNIVQGVSYPNPNFSHFRATDIWNSGSDAKTYINTGWLGRYLSESHSGYPVGYPNSSMPDPLAIQIGTGVSPVVQGPQVNMGMAISDINSFYNIINGTVNPAPATPAGHELTFIRYISQQTQTYTSVIQTAAGKSRTLSSKYPSSGNSLADQLKVVARLIAGGLQTPVYVVSMGSFDTHSLQVDSTDHTIGAHANLLGQLSTAVDAFYDDLKLMGIDQRVTAMTFSEFGRRIMSNASGGTDHGTSEPVFVFGPSVNPTIVGSSPTIPSNVTVNDNLAMQHDYRSIYATVLSDWFNVSPTVLNNVMMATYPILPIFKQGTEVTPISGNSNEELLSSCYPNPIQRNCTVSFRSTGNGASLFQLIDVSGRLIQTIEHKEYSRGQHHLTFSRGTIPSGNYFLRLSHNNDIATKKLTFID